VAPGPTPERMASVPTDGRWARCRGGQFHHNSARQPRRRRPARAVPSPVGHTPRDKSFPTSKERESDRRTARPSRTGRGGMRPDRTSRCRGRTGVCTDWPPAAAARPAAAWAPGSSPQVHSARRWNVRQVKQVDSRGSGAPGKTQPPWRTRRGRRGCAWRTTGACGSGSGSSLSSSSSSLAAGTERQACRVTVVLGGETFVEER
jgi:hypothetical protein